VLYALDDGKWDIPGVRLLLETIIPQKAATDCFEVEHDFPNIGRRTMLLNARMVTFEDRTKSTILLAFNDITSRRETERQKEELLKHTEELLRQEHVLLREMHHRVANSLQIIASILLLKARAVSSEETRDHLRDAHQRVMSVAEVQTHLHASDDSSGQIDIKPYLTKLCAGLASSMVGESQPIAIRVIAHEGAIESSAAVSLGLIVTELVINALKYAFPKTRIGALILVTYEIDGQDWKLVVSDNGIGGKAHDPGQSGQGLGTAIVEALAKQLDARVDSVGGSPGMTVAVTRASFTSRLPQAA
jgi:chemotaxis protein methyltransferase CheR